MGVALAQCLVRTMKTLGMIQGLQGQNQSRVVLLEPSNAFLKLYGVRNELPTIKVSVSRDLEGSCSPTPLTRLLDQNK